MRLPADGRDRLVRETAADREVGGQADPFGRWSEACIIASGPSLTAGDCELVRQWSARRSGRCVIAINRSVELAPWADVLYAADAKWWRQHADIGLAFAGERWTTSHEPGQLPGVNYIVHDNRGIGLCRDPTKISTGGNSGYQAINLTYHWGIRRMILLGYDMQHTGGKRHWHPNYPAGMDNATPVHSWRERFKPLARDLARAGVEVVNATRQTALTAFPRITLEAALA